MLLELERDLTQLWLIILGYVLSLRLELSQIFMQLQNSLNELMDKMNAATPHFVRYKIHINVVSLYCVVLVDVLSPTLVSLLTVSHRTMSYPSSNTLEY